MSKSYGCQHQNSLNWNLSQFQNFHDYMLAFRARSWGSWFRILNFSKIIPATSTDTAVWEWRREFYVWNCLRMRITDIDWRGFASLNWIFWNNAPWRAENHIPSCHICTFHMVGLWWWFTCRTVGWLRENKNKKRKKKWRKHMFVRTSLSESHNLWKWNAAIKSSTCLISSDIFTH